MANNQKVKISKTRAVTNAVTKFSKSCALVLTDTAGSLKQVYANNKAQLDSEMKINTGVYANALALGYAALKMPETLVTKSCGPVANFFLKMWYGQFITPFETLIRMLDIRTYRSVITSIIATIRNCFPKALSTLWNGLLDMLSKLFGIIKSLGKGKKYISRLCQRQMLTEAKRESLMRRMINWVKDKAVKVAEICKSTLMWLLKKGWNAVFYLFQKFITPIAQCVTSKNKTTFNFSQYSSKESLQDLGSKIFDYLGLTATAGVGAVAASVMGPLSIPIAGFFMAFSSISGAFAIFATLNDAGNYMEMADMFFDVGGILLDM